MGMLQNILVLLYGYVSTHLHNRQITWVCLNMSLYFSLFLDFLELWEVFFVIVYKKILVCSNIPV